MQPDKQHYALVLLTVVVFLLLLYTHCLYTRNAELETTNLRLQQEVRSTVSSLEAYQLLESDIISLGATPELARTTIQAAELYNLNPK